MISIDTVKKYQSLPKKLYNDLSKYDFKLSTLHHLDYDDENELCLVYESRGSDYTIWIPIMQMDDIDVSIDFLVENMIAYQYDGEFYYHEATN